MVWDVSAGIFFPHFKVRKRSISGDTTEAACPLEGPKVIDVRHFGHTPVVGHRELGGQDWLADEEFIVLRGTLDSRRMTAFSSSYVDDGFAEGPCECFVADDDAM